MNPFILFSGITFCLSFLAVNLIRKHFRKQFIDIPNDRSSHSIPTPRGGGMGFIVAFAIVLLLGHFCIPQLIPSNAIFVLVALLPLIGIGILDDWCSVSSIVRYLVQLSVSILIVCHYGAFPQPWLMHLGTPGHWIAIVLTIIGITALINFYNFMDGLDGLVAGVTATQLSFFAIWFNQPSLWLLVAALLGFLYWNWSPAKIFMGDAGSTMLGATVAITLLQGSSTTQAWSAIVILLPLVGDAIYTLGCRAKRRENIFKAHRTHIYQRLHQSGWQHRQVATFYILGTIVIGTVISLDPTITPIMVPFLVIIAIRKLETYINHTNHYQPKHNISHQTITSSENLSQIS
jgi:Fuc2NAc and GlcNAc transferase